MYVEKLTLFIVGEILAVYIVISLFLFWRGRLFRILKDLLKEMRYNRDLRERLKAEKARQQRGGNKTLAEAIQDSITSGGPEIHTNQVDFQLQRLEEKGQQLGVTGIESYDPNASVEERMLALGKILLSLETLNKDDVSDADPTANAIVDDIIRVIEVQSQTPQPSEEQQAFIKKLQGELVHQKARLENMERYESMYIETKKELEDAKDTIEQLQTITPTDSQLAPRMGDYTDEIYKLKTEKFDMMETINGLKLELDQMKGSEEPLNFIEKQEAQIAAQARYMKEADVCISLMEKELEAANNDVNKTREEVAALKKQLEDAQNQAPIVTTAVVTVNKENTEKLAQAKSEQNDAVSNLKQQIDSLKQIEEAQDIVTEQVQEIGRLERSIQESETCVKVMEDELDLANKKLNDMQQQMEQMTALNENSDRLESMVQTFIKDSEEMMDCINKLEQENEGLREKVQSLQTKTSQTA